ncbi:aldo/keto reductase [Ahrensia sp. R2A130]|uniref:aldo/keto reductase n=1 Tax=Ahrensia sp. R2A130 TaxID=744979 RepID=UPI0001E0B4DA|nr:aldo/keto reductase [Ahrensia sp. R2A130]EFL88724.1 aldo/keto reductase [Ahrensia sp. R2A130]
MDKRKLGTDGPMVSEIGLGCWSFAGSYGPTDKAESFDTLRTCQDLGIDFLDTAKAYGNGLSEEIIGEFMDTHDNDFVVASKGGIYRDPDSGARGFRNDEEYLRDCLEGSLKRLRMEQIPLYYVHKRDDRPIEDVMCTMLKFQQEGKIAHIAFCEISPASLRTISEMGKVAAVQSEYSLWTRYHDLGMIETCKELDVAFVPFSPLGRGIFATQAPDPATFGEGDFRTGTPRFAQPNLARNLAYVERFKALAQDMGTTSPTLAVAWCLARGEHLLPIPGTRSTAHLQELAAASTLKLTDENMMQIEAILPVGWAAGDRYSRSQWAGVEGYC